MDKNTLGDVPTEVWRLIYKTFKEEVLDLIDIDNSVDAEKVAAIVAQPDGASRVKDLVNLLKGKRGAILAAFGPAYSSHAADCIVEAWKACSGSCKFYANLLHRTLEGRIYRKCMSILDVAKEIKQQQ